MTTCPVDDVLKQVLAEQLSALEVETVTAHVDACPRCQEKLAQLTEDESSWLGLKPRPAQDTVRWRQLAEGESALSAAGGARIALADHDAFAVEGFEILECLGRGGMGIVYKARDRKLKRLVALKVISAGANADPEKVLRFRSEAEAAARLQHPNIVPIYETGDANGRPYFCSEYLDGGTLAQHLACSPQPARQAAALIETLARAIHYAHDNGIIHRDLKPANILLRGEGRGARKETRLPSPVAPRLSPLRRLPISAWRRISPTTVA